MKDTGFMLAMLDVLANRDVSDEARDENGKWTDGGSAPGTPGRDASLVTRIGHWFKALIGGAITNADPGDPTADTTPPLITDANVAALSASAGFLDLPAPWREAIRRFKTKKLLPTTLTSEEISALPDEIRRRCFFSARVAEAEALDDIAKTVDKAITGAAGGQAAEARIAINQVMQDFGTPFKGGRANLIVTTQADMARGYARFRAGNTKLAVNMWPAYEFYRAEERIEPREWPARWADAGGEFFDGDSDYPEGRMVALKTDPIWTTISAFGQPYAPFDFNSGMDLREVSRSEAENLGLLTEDDELDPAPDPDFNEGVEVASAKGLSPDIQTAMLDTLGDGYEFKDGVLALKNRDVSDEARVPAGGPGGGEFTAGGAAPSSKSELAKASYKPATAENQRKAEANESIIANAIGGTQSGDNDAFDVRAGKFGIEVKTIIGGKNPKITMHPDSLARKKSTARKEKLKSFTVAVDMRGNEPEFYVEKGVGSFRLAGMNKVGSLGKLKEYFHGLPALR